MLSGGEGRREWKRESYVCQERCTSPRDWCSSRIFFLLSPSTLLFPPSFILKFFCIAVTPDCFLFFFSLSLFFTFFSPHAFLSLSLSLLLSLSLALSPSFCDLQQKADGVSLTSEWIAQTCCEGRAEEDGAGKRRLRRKDTTDLAEEAERGER